MTPIAICYREMAVIHFLLIRRAPHPDYIPLSFDEHRWLPSTRQSTITAPCSVCSMRPFELHRSILHYIIAPKTSTSSTIAFNQHWQKMITSSVAATNNRGSIALVRLPYRGSCLHKRRFTSISHGSNKVNSWLVS